MARQNPHPHRRRRRQKDSLFGMRLWPRLYSSLPRNEREGTSTRKWRWDNINQRVTILQGAGRQAGRPGPVPWTHSLGYNNDAESIRNAMQQAMGVWDAVPARLLCEVSWIIFCILLVAVLLLLALLLHFERHTIPALSGGCAEQRVCRRLFVNVCLLAVHPPIRRQSTQCLCRSRTHAMETTTTTTMVGDAEGGGWRQTNFLMQ